MHCLKMSRLGYNEFTTFLLIGCTLSRSWIMPEAKGVTRTTSFDAERLKLVSEGCDPRFVSILSLYLKHSMFITFTDLSCNELVLNITVVSIHPFVTE